MDLAKWTVADRIRVFQATSGGPGAAISTTTTNHGALQSVHSSAIP